jgi:hypothetical protein
MEGFEAADREGEMLNHGSSRLVLGAVLLAVTGGSAACHTWVPLAPLNLGLESQACMPLPDRQDVRLYAVDGSVREGKLIEVFPDSIRLGTGPDSWETFAIDKIRRAEVRKPDGGRTALAGLGIAAGVLTLGATVASIEEEATGSADATAAARRN